MQFPIIYLHIPKTAGTSFRLSAEQYFGPEQVLNDYGEKSPNTSDDIRNSVYDSNDTKALRASGLRKNFLTGHFALAKYREIFPDSPVVTFFRDPVDRVISEYFHFSSHYNFEGSLRDFYTKSHFQNRQAHALSGALPTDLDYFGITEQYDKSLQMFNRRYSTNFPMAKLNTGRYQGGTQELASAEEIAEIEALNQRDIELYDYAIAHFTAQESSAVSPLKTTNRYCGILGGMSDEALFGWTVDRESCKPVEIAIAVNGEIRHQQPADVYREDLMRKGYHIDGTCGFNIPVAKLGTVMPGDRITVRTQDGNFELTNSPLVFNG